ncbi:hypothetical protein H5410_033080 [Solanum commersonii]|uniref:Uncharacterized protein n=2 Tax=Solanum TaxID=4107 RepID=A0A9J5YS15_SOLCO|nr:hypothetical protein H5410_033080 [Solanum commersonii]
MVTSKGSSADTREYKEEEVPTMLKMLFVNRKRQSTISFCIANGHINYGEYSVALERSLGRRDGGLSQLVYGGQCGKKGIKDVLRPRRTMCRISR